jgi:hypothetical protein
MTTMPVKRPLARRMTTPWTSAPSTTGAEYFSFLVYFCNFIQIFVNKSKLE